MIEELLYWMAIEGGSKKGEDWFSDYWDEEEEEDIKEVLLEELNG